MVELQKKFTKLKIQGKNKIEDHQKVGRTKQHTLRENEKLLGKTLERVHKPTNNRKKYKHELTTLIKCNR